VAIPSTFRGLNRFPSLFPINTSDRGHRRLSYPSVNPYAGETVPQCGPCKMSTDSRELQQRWTSKTTTFLRIFAREKSA
jgi:hypothetical protein